MIDQQQQLQLAIVAENHQLKEHVRNLSGFPKTSRSIKKWPENDKDDTLSNNINSSQVKDKNDKQEEKKEPKNKANNSWWHFWKKLKRWIKHENRTQGNVSSQKYFRRVWKQELLESIHPENVELVGENEQVKLYGVKFFTYNDGINVEQEIENLP